MSGEIPCELHLTLPPALGHPGTTDLTIALDEICPTCEGSRDDPTESRTIDPIFSGGAQVSINLPVPCRRCDGKGWVLTEQGTAIATLVSRHMRVQ